MKDMKFPHGKITIESAFDYVDHQHIPTIKLRLPAILADDSDGWDRRDNLAKAINDLLKYIIEQENPNV